MTLVNFTNLAGPWLPHQVEWRKHLTLSEGRVGPDNPL